MIGDQGLQFVDIETEVSLLSQTNGYCAGSGIVNHRLINREAGIGIDNLVSAIRQGKKRKKNNRLATGDDDYFVSGDLDSPRAVHVLGDDVAQLGQTSRGSIMSPALPQGLDPCFHYIFWCIEVRLADF